MGFPPFYRGRGMGLILPWVFLEQLDSLRLIKLSMPFVFGLLITALLFEEDVFFVLFGSISFLGGLRVRQDLRKTVGGPLPWLTNAWTVKWPMLVFDIWTLAICLGFGLLISK
jgi:hypothetical protein